MAEEKTLLLTQEAYDKMKEELVGAKASIATRSFPRFPRLAPRAI